jgi:hypothetical protein
MEAEMRKIVTTVGAAALAIGLGASAPTPAAANPVLIAPLWLAAIVVGSVATGAMVGASAAHANDVAYAPPPPGPQPGVFVTDEPSGPGCYYTRAVVHGAYHRVQVCN